MHHQHNFITKPSLLLLALFFYPFLVGFPSPSPTSSKPQIYQLLCLTKFLILAWLLAQSSWILCVLDQKSLPKIQFLSPTLKILCNYYKFFFMSLLLKYRHWLYTCTLLQEFLTIEDNWFYILLYANLQQMLTF